MVTIPILYMNSILDTLMSVVFEQKSVKCTIFFYFTLTGAIVLIKEFSRKAALFVAKGNEFYFHHCFPSHHQISRNFIAVTMISNFFTSTFFFLNFPCVDF